MAGQNSNNGQGKCEGRRRKVSCFLPLPRAKSSRRHLADITTTQPIFDRTLTYIPTTVHRYSTKFINWALEEYRPTIDRVFIDMYIEGNRNTDGTTHSNRDSLKSRSVKNFTQRTLIAKKGRRTYLTVELSSWSTFHDHLNLSTEKESCFAADFYSRLVLFHLHFQNVFVFRKYV